MSLRTRLAVLTAFAACALLIALFVAWRLARATETFTLRQTEFSLHAAARDLVREVRAHPEGQTASASPGAPPSPDAKSRRPHRPPLPPHEAKLFAAYTDPLARLTAIALHPYPETAGGFYRADGALAGYAFPEYAGTGINTEATADEAALIRALAQQALATGEAAARTATLSDGATRMFVSYPAQPNDAGESDQGQTSNANTSIVAVWTMRKLSSQSATTADTLNIIALAGLGLAFAAITSLAFVTVRDLRTGVRNIESGMIQLRTNLEHRLPPARTPELARIASAINELAANLNETIARQRDLERDLRKSERLAALGRLIAGVAHEVRNPLASMKLKMQIARRAAYAPDKLEATFRVVTEEIERLDALVRRLLELGRAPALELAAFDVCDMARRRAAFILEKAERQNVRVIVKELCAKLLIEGDRDRLGQVLDNLFQNALEAMPDGGTLTIACERLAAAETEGAVTLARLSVADTGGGIAPEHVEHIFEPFYSGRDAGTGLGLAIAREIVEAHGGKLSFGNQAPGGALFHLELPEIAAASNHSPNI